MADEGRIAAFLGAHGWRIEDMRPLAADASFRRYFRLDDGARRAVLMDAPPPHEDVRPFARVARHLCRLGLSAPAITGEDAVSGLLLLEDLGDDTFTRLLDQGAAAEALYALAVDVLIDLHKRFPMEVTPVGLPAYDEALLLGEACLLTDWYLPAVTGEALSSAQQAAYVDAWRAVLPAAWAMPQTLVLRDFHVDNLIRLDGRSGVAACGLLDFQDAVIGAPAYDLMSLLQDARRDVPADLQTAMLERYRSAFPGLDRPAFDRAYRVLAAQRHAKVIGIFTRLCRRDGKAAYLAHIPRVWRMLEAALEDPALAPVTAWFAANVPAAERRVPDWRPAAE